MKKRVFIFTLIILVIIISLAAMPHVGYTIGGYSPEELERLVIKSLQEGGMVRLANIKYRPLFWWPFLKTIYDKTSLRSQVASAFLICLPYWLLVAFTGSLIIEGIYYCLKIYRRQNGQEK